MVAIRAALNLQHGGVKDFYICSLSSRFRILNSIVCLNLVLSDSDMVSYFDVGYF